ncbi:META domain-containing protein [Sphingomonas xanthus]|uniref:META domain-containing protein n=1 Tax=Sphingomonas xanthus TaxID=2594473 RepID=A0A516ISK6_9SPHN|nr:META domain-containing protein [Sphingomonas xanthus]QDP19804.1 META domain-containing protein [Sphingomonas xanthus]
MNRLALLLPLALSACLGPTAAVDPAREVRPVTVQDRLQGRWAIVAVDGRPSGGLSLTLGAQGLATAAGSGPGTASASPQPPSSAYLGCNELRIGGWARNGDKLTLGTDHATITERGCDPATMALEERAHAILRKTLTMELTPPDRLRLINEVGTLDLVRSRRP